MFVVFSALALGVWLTLEGRTSYLQSRILSRTAAEIGWSVGLGASPEIRFPGSGPADVRAGYSIIGSLVDSLSGSGFGVASQARPSQRFLDLLDRGLFPIYDEKPQVGLTILDRHGDSFFDARYPQRVYTSFDEIPALVWTTLLHIESREMLDPRFPYRNPAVEWDRFARGATELALRELGREGNVQGGSTLATQTEKFRHSPQGLTRTPLDKLRQIASASLRAYMDGPVTLGAQREIIRSYINSVPTAAQARHGEVLGLADGLGAWYGAPFDHTNALLHALPDTLAPEALEARAAAYRQVLSLFIAHRRPSYYLATVQGREELVGLTDRYLRILSTDSVIPQELARSAREVELELKNEAPPLPPPPFEERKAADRVRRSLLSLLGVPGLYDLDRLDLTAESTIDIEWQAAAERLIHDITTDADFREREGFSIAPLLDRGDPAAIVFSVFLAEVTDRGVEVRVQTDNYAGPLDFNSSARVELGSTAKLRTLVTYLELIHEVHGKLAVMPRETVRALTPAPRDRLTVWVRDWVLANPGTTSETVLQAALDRVYSASPAQRFATGGGTQTFSNFEAKHNTERMTVREGFRHSVNLVSIRTMEDVVEHLLYREPEALASVLDAGALEREDYLIRFARDEGGRFVSQFFRQYEGLEGDELLDRVVAERSLGPERMGWAFRAVRPDAPLEEFDEFMVRNAGAEGFDPGEGAELYGKLDPTEWTWADLGYLARIHPLDLWAAKYRVENPEATRADAIGASEAVARDVYRWLFRTRRRNAQDVRIRTVLETEAFAEILERWQRLGYPFRNIVPSLGTAIGSSGDRASALADMLAVIQNDGVRLPTTRVQALHFAEGTPFETSLRREELDGARVLPSAVAEAVRGVLVDVVENGTGRRALGVLTSDDGPLVVGGKTGTGDNRYRVFGPGGRLTEERVVNRTSTFAFIAGDRHVGVIVAYVPGQAAADYTFTSALATQMLQVLAREWNPLVGTDAVAPRGG